jgi:hypothetical protein
MKRSLFVALLLLMSFRAFAELPARTFSHPDRIRYDSRCLIIEGRDTFIYSGAFHYFRCPKELWRDRFQKIKDAGFNAVETYGAWNWHERAMPANLTDFSKVDLTDFEDWLNMAEAFGFYIIVRPGPYICAEWDTGGFPQWLLTKRPDRPRRAKAWLRSDDPVYLAWCRHWYDAVCPVIARHQITRQAPSRPGVILVQLENEYDYAGLPAEVMLNQVRALAETAQARGIEVPLFTCWTHPVRGQADPLLRQVFDSCNFYPRWKVDEIAQDIRKLRREQPDAPLATTELQGGWFSQVGGSLSEDQEGLTAAQINNLTLFAIQNGETILNYYMLFGGTNPGDWGARDLTTTYDYNAPIREWGGVGARYQRVRALGAMLREHGASLARSEPVECEVTGAQADVAVALRRAPDGSRYFFIRTSQHLEPRAGAAHVRTKQAAPAEVLLDYKLEPFGSAVLYLPPGVTDPAHGEWLPKSAPAIERPAVLPASVEITSALKRDDKGPSRWQRITAGQSLAQLGVYDSRYVIYRAKPANRTATNLFGEYPSGDDVVLSANGKRLARSGSAAGSSSFVLPAGAGDLQLLYENHGHPNGGAGLEQRSGILAAQLTKTLSAGGKPIPGWRMQEVNGTRKRPEIMETFKDDDWIPVGVDNLEADTLPSGHKAVYRAAIEISASDLPSAKKILRLGRVDDTGWVYANGTLVGRTTDWSRSYAFDLTSYLHPGRNSIAILVQNNEGAGGLGAPTLGEESDSAPLSLDAFGFPQGFDEEWWKAECDQKRWKAVRIPEQAANAGANALLSWYRLRFELEPRKPEVWTPWRLRLVANGNGFLYLNGRPLGRYWQAGPQHDFFLPESWLNFGSGNPNILALNLRPTAEGAAIRSASVEPYGEFAEKRKVPSAPTASSPNVQR